MATKSITKAFNDILLDGSIISNCIKNNAELIARYGIDVPVFTANLDAALTNARELNERQERLKSELKSLSLELNGVLVTIEKQYALSKKTVKLAEPHANWLAYGIKDKKY